MKFHNHETKLKEASGFSVLSEYLNTEQTTTTKEI